MCIYLVMFYPYGVPFGFHEFIALSLLLAPIGVGYPSTDFPFDHMLCNQESKLSLVLKQLGALTLPLRENANLQLAQ